MTPTADIDRTTRLRLPQAVNPADVYRFLRTARALARRNRNKGGHRAIKLISTDAAAVNAASPFNRRLVARDGLDGQYRPNAGAACIYIRPGQNREETIFTLVHEVTHHYSTGSHGRPFRRLYSILLAAAVEIFLIPIRKLNRELNATILRYVKPDKDQTVNSKYWTSDLSTQELFNQACLEAAKDCVDKFAKGRAWLAEPQMRALLAGA